MIKSRAPSGIVRKEFSNFQEHAENSNNYLFCDSELTVIKIWSEYKYGSIDPLISTEHNKRSYDLYLLLDIDLPWEYDSQRENPERRKYFFDWFEKALVGKKKSRNGRKSK